MTTAELEDGRHFGFISAVDPNSGTMAFDLAEFRTGDDAILAAVEDGVIHAGQTLDNDYYIRNRNPRLRDLALAAGVRILLVDWASCCEATVSGQLQDFAAGFADPNETYRGGQSPYWLTVEGGLVTAIEEQYLP